MISGICGFPSFYVRTSPPGFHLIYPSLCVRRSSHRISEPAPQRYHYPAELWGRPSHLHILFSSRSERAMVIVDVLGKCYPSLPTMSITAAHLFGSSDSISTRCSLDLARTPNGRCEGCPQSPTASVYAYSDSIRPPVMIHSDQAI